jgi:hypothetical protein
MVWDPLFHFSPSLVCVAREKCFWGCKEKREEGREKMYQRRGAEKVMRNILFKRIGFEMMFNDGIFEFVDEGLLREKV